MIDVWLFLETFEVMAPVGSVTLFYEWLKTLGDGGKGLPYPIKEITGGVAFCRFEQYRDGTSICIDFYEAMANRVIT